MSGQWCLLLSLLILKPLTLQIPQIFVEFVEERCAYTSQSNLYLVDDKMCKQINICTLKEGPEHYVENLFGH